MSQFAVRSATPSHHLVSHTKKRRKHIMYTLPFTAVAPDYFFNFPVNLLIQQR